MILGIQLIILILLIFRKQKTGSDDTITDNIVSSVKERIRESEQELKQEFVTNRKEHADQNSSLRTELHTQLHQHAQQVASQFDILNKHNDDKLERIRRTVEDKITAFQTATESAGKEQRLALTQQMQQFKTDMQTTLNEYQDKLKTQFERYQQLQEAHQQSATDKLSELKLALERSVREMQEGNEKKLDEMRKTVDEKLHDTLEKRLGESFKQVSDRLEAVHKGLGEMQHLANSVGDLKKVMSNVKSRGVLGEYQLENILEDLLTNEQYGRNVKTKSGSGAVVEFAIKMPNGQTLDKSIWLPIDSKFPKEDYEALTEAYEKSDTTQIDECRKAFIKGIRKNAQDIRDKYIDPPNTTEYGIMFLPYESLFGEVLRTPGLFEQLQREFKIVITGPTTLSALLNCLQMGFRTLAIEKRSSEVWDLLGAVKTEFGQFGDVLAKTKKKLIEATNVIESSETRSRVIERKLRDVQAIPSSESNAQSVVSTEE
jgi:DNA recombination protein RmuC